MRYFEEELQLLRNRLLEMSALVESAIVRSVAVLAERDRNQIEQLNQNEDRINRMEMEIDDLATSLLALDQPVAADLRLITAALKINNDLERIADLAVNISEWALEYLESPPLRLAVDIPQLASLVQSMVRKAIDSFVAPDPALARAVLVSDDVVDRARDSMYSTLMHAAEQDSSAVRQAVALMFVAHNLERIADHATNIAEDVLFLVEGIDVRHGSEARSGSTSTT